MAEESNLEQVQEAPAPEAPKKRTRRSTAKAKQSASQEPASQETEVTAEGESAASKEKAKPSVRRQRKKAEEPEVPAAPQEAAVPAEADEVEPVKAQRAKSDEALEKPGVDVAEKPRRRTRRVKVNEDQTEVPKAADNPEEAKKAEGNEGPAKRNRAKASEDSKEAADNASQSEEKSNGSDEKARNQKAQQKPNNNASQQRGSRHQRRQRNNREVEPSVTREELSALKVAELRERAVALELDAAGMKKAELVEAVFAASVRAEGFVDVAGVLDILSDGYGFLRTTGYLPGETDCYVGTSLIKRNGLRKGDYIEGTTRPVRDNEKFAAIQKINRVNGMSPEELAHRPRFADLTPIYPSERLVMEHGKNTTTARVIDLVAPIGKGQRGLIVSPPKAGKTTILKDIAASISANNPEVHLMCLLVDERPEEVTDMQRSIKGEVISSTFDMPADNHIAVAEMVIERAKRLVETGRDVVILLDSITRLARAYNLAQPASGRVLSGGVDSTALYPPKRFLGAARNIEHGGSLTILASALIETGSKMDEVIFEEFKGTGNMELRLDRQLADRRIFPAIDPVASGTRKEELLLDSQLAPLIWAVRRLLANMNNTERAMDMLIKSIRQTDDNNEFLLRTARKAQHSKSETLEL